jgi:hypothetical protein
MEELVCSRCHFHLSPEFYFCPYCGRKIKEPPPSTSFAKQMSIYIFSVFFPPFGLWPAFRYLRQPEPKKKTIGVVAIVLTIISLAWTVWFTLGFMKQFNQSFDQQMQLYRNMGY